MNQDELRHMSHEELIATLKAIRPSKWKKEYVDIIEGKISEMMNEVEIISEEHHNLCQESKQLLSQVFVIEQEQRKKFDELCGYKPLLKKYRRLLSYVYLWNKKVFQPQEA